MRLCLEICKGPENLVRISKSLKYTSSNKTRADNICMAANKDTPGIPYQELSATIGYIASHIPRGLDVTDVKLLEWAIIVD